MEPLLGGLARGDVGGILVGDPAGVHAVHVDAVVVVVGRGGARHHVERRLGHVRVRMARGLARPVELPFDSRDIDDVLVASGRPQHQRLQPRIDDERRDGVDELHLQQLDGRHVGEEQPPRVPSAQVDLLQILIEPPFGKQIAAASAAACESARQAVRRHCDTRQPARAGDRRQAAACGSGMSDGRSSAIMCA